MRAFAQKATEMAGVLSLLAHFLPAFSCCPPEGALRKRFVKNGTMSA
jgi:hypothetical protein